MDGGAFKRMVLSAAAMIENKKQAVNELNVFPVPDGDTGTNMSMTLHMAANDLLKKDEPTLSEAAKITSGALLRGARGNSGVITSLLFRGFAEAFKGKDEADGALFASALGIGVDAAYKAVMRPAEGTILTVCRVTAAAAAEEAEKDPGIEHVMEYSLGICKDAVAQTVHQNPVLEKAGVVDAGGEGFALILEAMLLSLRGKDVQANAAANEPAREEADFSEFDTESIKFQYCTEFIVNRENKKDPEKLRPFLGKLGDSLVLVADDEIIKVHVHTNHPGTVFEEALTYGSFVTCKVENMKLQHTEKVLKNEKATKGPKKPAAPTKDYGVVAVCAGEGLASVFSDLGADGIISGGQTMNPSTEDILEQVEAVPAKTVFVLPNNKNIILAAQQAAELTEKNVVVIESTTVPQGIAAMLGYDESLSADEIAGSMTEALSGVTTMLLTYAARNSDFDGNSISEGDYMALYEKSLLKTDKDLGVVLQALAEKAAENDFEYLNLFYGEGVTEEDAEAAADVFRAALPNAEVNVVNGGQPVYYYMISAEA